MRSATVSRSFNCPTAVILPALMHAEGMFRSIAAMPLHDLEKRHRMWRAYRIAESRLAREAPGFDGFCRGMDSVADMLRSYLHGA